LQWRAVLRRPERRSKMAAPAWGSVTQSDFSRITAELASTNPFFT
jgi:hypothetical protein